MLSGNNAISAPLERRELLSCFQYPSPPPPPYFVPRIKCHPPLSSPGRARAEPRHLHPHPWGFEIFFWGGGGGQNPSSRIAAARGALGVRSPGRRGAGGMRPRGFAWLRQRREPVPAALHRARGTGTRPTSRCVTLSAQGSGFAKQTPPAPPAPRAIQGGKFKKNKKLKKKGERTGGFDANGVLGETGERTAAVGTEWAPAAPGAERAPAAPAAAAPHHGGGVHRDPSGTVPRPRGGVTFLPHPHAEALLQAAVLALVAVMLVDLAVAVGPAGRTGQMKCRRGATPRCHRGWDGGGVPVPHRAAPPPTSPPPSGKALRLGARAGRRCATPAAACRHRRSDAMETERFPTAGAAGSLCRRCPGL